MRQKRKFHGHAWHGWCARLGGSDIYAPGDGLTKGSGSAVANKNYSNAAAIRLNVTKLPVARGAATRALGVAQNCAHPDYQFNFEVLPADYENTNPGWPWMGSGKIHPVAATGGAVLADATLDALRPR